MSDYTEKFEKMRAAGSLAAKTLDMLTSHIKPGISTDELDNLGYSTACVGKWHLGHLEKYMPTNHGFDCRFDQRLCGVSFGWQHSPGVLGIRPTFCVSRAGAASPCWGDCT